MKTPFIFSSFCKGSISTLLFALLCPTLLPGQNLPNLAQTAPAGTTTEILTPPARSSNGGQTNYYRTFEPKVPIANAAVISEATPATEVSMATSFKDGFNNPMELVIRNATPNAKKNVVVPYDGRAIPGTGYQFLPYATASDVSSDPGVGPDANTFSNQRQYYQGAYPGEGYTAYSATKNASDANSRKSQLFLPGKSQVGQNRAVVEQKITNDGGTIRIWELDANAKPTANGFYTANQLFGTQTSTIEGENGIAYNDKDGNLIYKKILLTNAPVKWAETYYVYDELGRLRFSIPPKAVEAIGGSTTISPIILANLCFQYQYDNKGRFVSFRHPGQGDATVMVYDRHQRLVMRQNPLQAQLGKWEVLYYDNIGRVVATSLYQDGNSRSYWQNMMDNPPANPASNTIAYYLTTDAGEENPPTETAISGNTMLTYSYYDNYGQTLDNNGIIFNLVETEQAFGGDLLSSQSAEYPQRSLRTHNMITGRKIRILKSPNAPQAIGDWRHEVYYYDDKGRPIVTAIFDKLNNQGQLDYHHASFVSAQYDFSGNILIAKHTAKNLLSQDGNNVHTELLKKEYDPSSGLLVKTSHNVNNAGWNTVSLYSYDELGRVNRQVLGDYGEVQDLSYNIRSQLTGINAVYAETGNKENQSRTFGQSIKYDYGFKDPRRDAKIAGIVWRGAGVGAKPMAYGYNYDQGARLTKADFSELNGTTWSNTAKDYSVSNLTYDVTGDIKSMKQRGMILQGGSIVPADIDRLSYTYNDLTYRLNRVEDTVTQDYGLGEFVNGNAGSADYEYDVMGNMVMDKNKHIQNIVYNYLNKPEKVLFDNGSSIEYSYNARGTKVEEIITPASGPSVRTDYLSNFTFRNDSLQFILHEKGRTVFDHGTGTTKEEFFVQDYHGNIRSVIDIINYPIIEYLASYELASANLEGLLFEHHNEVRDDKPGSIDPQDNQSGRLNGSEPDRRLGTALLIKVMAGDRIDLKVNSYYEDYDQNADAPVPVEEMLGSVINTLVGGAGGFEGSESHNVEMVNNLFTENNYVNLYNGVVQESTDPALPKAYLNYIVFDERMEVVSEYSRSFQATGDNQWTEIGSPQPMEIPINGYVAVYINNHSSYSVFFDQLSVKLSRGRLKEENHYYPFGLPMGNIGSAASGFLPNKYRYQANTNHRELGLNLMDFHNRFYDAQIGRFTGVDALSPQTDMISPYAGMANDPVHFVDPFGLSIFDAQGWNAQIGAYFGGQFNEIVILGNGSTKTIDNPGGGMNIYAPYVIPQPSWDEGAAGGVKRGTEHHATGAGNGKTNHAPVNTAGSPMGTKNGVQGGTDPNGVGTEAGGAGNDPEGKGAEEKDGWLTLPWSSEDIHNTLDYIGYVPGLGDAADLLNASLYLAEGDLLNAALSAGSALPFGGYVFSGVKVAGKVAKKSGSRIFEVGAYKTIKGVENGLDAHHVGQQALMKKFVQNYDPKTAPAILVPKQGHTLGKNVVSRNVSGFQNARQVLARDIKELKRVYPDIPNSSLEDLIKMNKSMYPDAFLK